MWHILLRLQLHDLHSHETASIPAMPMLLERSSGALLSTEALLCRLLRR